MKKVSPAFLAKLLAVSIAGLIVINFGFVYGFATKFLSVLQPVFIGITVALILNVPMELFENKVFFRLKNEKFRRIISLVVTLVLFFGVVALVVFIALPSAVESVKGIISNVNGENWEKFCSDNKFVSFLLKQLRTVYDGFLNKLNDYVPKVLELATKFLSTVANVILGIGISIMILVNKRGLKKQIKKFILGICPNKEKIKKMVAITDIALTKFSRYLGGQVIEAILMGVVCYLCMLVLRLPYAVLISLIIAFVNVIPIVGSYIGGILGWIFIFSVSPSKSIVFIIFVIILQQVESFTTYPIIVGKYVGLNGFWIMISVIIWGGLLGFWGIFLGVPITAFLHDYVSLWLKQKNTLTEKITQ